MEKVKLIPYGISNFLQVRRENKYYVDKTMFLQRLETAGNFLFLTRPRRFGKSIFLTMMRTYYDVNQRDNFDRNFADLYVHQHPTEGMGQYQVLFLDFSQVGGDSKSVEERFERYGCNVLNQFAQNYSRFYDKDFAGEVQSRATFADKLTWIAGKARDAGHQLYLIIDEYDNFTNSILNHEGEHVYHELTHATGFYRDMFKLFKPNFTRILMMGISPVTLDDLTSGYNIAISLSLRPEFNTMLGFSELEVREMIRYYQQAGALKADEDAIVADMKPWYDNYCFAKDSFATDPRIFNTDMVINYLNYYLNVGHAPEQLVDNNAKTDYKKLQNLVLIDKSDPRRLNIIHKIIEQGHIMGNIKESFPAERIADEENFVSLLFYYGMLTITGTMGALLQLGIPNQNVRLQYYAYIEDEFQRIKPIDTTELNIAYYQAAYEGQWRPMIEAITRDYSDNASVRMLMQGERNLQGFMCAYLAKNPYYLAAPEVEMNHGYCDFFFLPDHLRYPQVAHSYILELKYLKANATPAQAASQWQQAVEQIRSYAQSPTVQRLLNGTALHLLVVQIKGHSPLRIEEIARPN